jgi:hypothetical protein
MILQLARFRNNIVTVTTNYLSLLSKTAHQKYERRSKRKTIIHNNITIETTSKTLLATKAPSTRTKI